MKRIFIVFLTFILIICSAYSAFAAETAGFSIGSAEAAKNRIVTLDCKCDNSSKLAAGIFEFTYDRSKLEFKGAECEDGIKVKYNSTDDLLKLVYHNYSEKSIDSGIIFKLKFKTLDYGKSEISFNAYQCVGLTPNDINVGKCSAGYIDVNPNAVGSDGSSGSKSSSAAADKEKSSKDKKDKSSKSGDSGDDDESDDSDKPTLDDLGDINNIEENSGNNALMYFILIGIGVLILALTVIQIVKKIHTRQNNKTNKN